MASGWNLWVWLECIVVVIIIISFPYSTCISSFLSAASLFLCSFFKCFSFFVLYAYLYCVYALVGGAISIRDPYICAVSRVSANKSHRVFHRPTVFHRPFGCAVKT